MEIIGWQMFWPDWWKLWPAYHETYNPHPGYTVWYFSFGPLQMRGYR